MPDDGKSSNEVSVRRVATTELVQRCCRRQMNYRHAFHAGNFADVLKHLVLVRVIEHLKRKDKPFRFIDTHAGIGLYDVSSEEARRSGEWRNGIGLVLQDHGWRPIHVMPDSELATLIAPYFQILRTLNDGEKREETGLRNYPGSGEIARRLMRQQDRLVLNELHPVDAVTLRRFMSRDERIRSLQLDGWVAVKSLLPPKERRGVMLIDPPFEERGEFTRLQFALDEAVKRFATGITLLWYPIKAGGADTAFTKKMAQSGHDRLLMIELLVRHRDTPEGLNGAGLLIHNPPFGLDRQFQVILPWLSERLGQSSGTTWDVKWLAGE